MNCSFIVDKHSATSFLSTVKSYGIDMDIRTIDNLGSKNFYPIWTGDNKLDDGKVELINNKKMKLLLISDGESLQKMTLQWAIDIIKKFNIDSTQVIFFSYDLRSKETYKLLLDEFSHFREYPINVISMDTYLFERKERFGNLPLPTKEKKPYKYMCYNANAKEYRLFLVTELFRRGLDKQGLISLLFRYGNPTQMSSDFTERLGFDTTGGYGKSVDEYAKTEMVKRVPLILDQTMEQVDKWDRPVDINHIKNSYFNIVTESYMYNTSLPESHKTIFEMSEKTYKALLCQPFIHLGSYGVLKYMRSIGYKTFPELFDESYDDIINHTDRLYSVINSIERVCKMDNGDFHNIYCEEIIPKIEHNRDLVNSVQLKKKVWDNFLLELVDEN